MTEVQAAAQSAGPAADAGKLKANSLGVAQIVFFVIAAAAPLTAMTGGATGAFIVGNGPGTPAAYLLAGLILMLFSVGYANMSRFISNSGAFYSYVARGLGRPLGVGSALIAVLSYTVIQWALYGLFGFFADATGQSVGLHLPWYVYSVVAALVIHLLGRRQVEVNGLLLGVLLLAEIGVLLIFDAGVILHGGGPQGLSLSPFSASAFTSGAPGVSIMFAVASFVGFEATALFREEARDAARTIPRATYVAVLVITLVYALTSWAGVVAYGPDSIVKAATDHSATLWTDAAARYTAPLVGQIMGVLVLTSIFASMLAFHNTLTRYMYSMGREGLLPAALGRTHPALHSPVVAGTVQTLTGLAGILIFSLSHADPFSVMFNWMSALGTLGIVVLQLLVSAAILRFFQVGRQDTRPWHTVIAPTLGLLGLLYTCFLVVTNLPALSGSNSPVVRSFPYIVALALLGGAALTVWMRRQRPAMYQKFGVLLDQI